MEWNLMFFVNSVLLGIGLAMDAFSVSMVNGLNETKMSLRKTLVIAAVFGLFQAIMPMLGWICVHTIVQCFKVFDKFIPWIALVLLAFIGGKMLIDGIRNSDLDEKPVLGIKGLLLQGIATSIDALSVGFTIADYGCLMATIEALITGIITFIFCIGGVCIGKKFGTKLQNKASILGGIILIAIGIEIFIKGII